MRSKLEFSTLICAPEYLNRKKEIERIQKKNMKFAHFLETGAFPDRSFDYELVCTNRGYTSLEHRRSCYLASFAVRVLKGKVPVPTLSEALNKVRQERRVSTGREVVLYLPTKKSNFYKALPAYRLASSINWLCEKTGHSIEHFMQFDNVTLKLILSSLKNTRQIVN